MLIWKNLWSSKIHERYKVFSWIIMSDALPVKVILIRFNHSLDLKCPIL